MSTKIDLDDQLLRPPNHDGSESNSAAAGSAKRLLTAFLVALCFFAAIAPTLDWMEFSNQIENLNVETALEIRRGGPVIVPTLMGEPRVRKPPLCAWVTAAGISPVVVADMSSPDTPTRETAWRKLAWQVRWPALLIASLTLALAYELGCTLLGHQIGLAGAAIAASTMLFQRYAVSAGTDVHLALWVTATNVCIVKLLFPRTSTVARAVKSTSTVAASTPRIASPNEALRNWMLWLLLGAALGLGMMSKGPVIYLMTLLPAGIFIAWRAAVERRSPIRLRPMVLPAALCTVVMLPVGFSWFIYAMQAHPVHHNVWWMEVFRTDPSEEATASWFDYIKLLPMMTPWTPFAIAGLWLGGRATISYTLRRIAPPRRDHALRLIYAGTLVLMPIVAMSFFRDRKPRYLYPFAIPMAILTAHALFELLRSRIGRPLVWLHWAIVAALVVGLPIVGMTGAFDRVRVDGSGWFSRQLGIALAAAACGAVVALALLCRLRPMGVALSTGAVMLGFAAMLTAGRQVNRSGDGVSEMLPVARLLWEQHPQVIAYNVATSKRIPPELAIYLNRPLREAASPASIPHEPHPQIYVDRQKRNEPPPLPAPGFEFFTRVPRDRDWWVVFLRKPPSR